MTVLWEGFCREQGSYDYRMIVVPLMIVLEIAQGNGWLQKLNHYTAKPFRRLGLGEEGVFPLVVAMLFGLTYGSGLIINHVRPGKVAPGKQRLSAPSWP